MIPPVAVAGGIFLICNGVDLHYEKLGRGPNVLLAFHGAGQTGRACYYSFAQQLGHYYTIYAFDLVFHGQSVGVPGAEPYADAHVVTKEILGRYLREFTGKAAIRRFDVAGFSMGGRYALATAEAFPDRIGRLLLMAPDGVVEHPLYSLGTRFGPARWLYRSFIHHPQRLFSALDGVQRMGFYPKNVVSFVKQVLATPERRQSIYRSWMSVRKLRFSIGTLYKRLQAKGVDVWLFVGKYDPIIRPGTLKVLSARLPPDRFIVLESGHGYLVDKVGGYLRPLLNEAK